MTRFALAALTLLGTLSVGASANAQQYVRVYSPEDTALVQSSSGVATSYAVPVTTYYRAPVTSYYAPTTAYYGPAVAPAVPVTSYYAPAAPVPVTSYYAPAAVPVTSYYAPAAVPVTAYYGAVIVNPRPYIPGQPVRNFFRGY